MTTTTDMIIPWGDVQTGDITLEDASLIYVDEVSVLPQDGHPDFLIAYVSGRLLSDDGSPRELYAAWIDVARDDMAAARERILNAQPDCDDNEPAYQWNGTETGGEWFDRTRDEVQPEPTADPSTAYHASVTDLRRGIAQDAAHWERRSWQILRQISGSATKVPPIVSDARAASLMAGNYGYTVAALLGVALREFGPEVGGRLASIADNVITNGDDDNLNADVMPSDDTEMPAGDAESDAVATEGDSVAGDTPEAVSGVHGAASGPVSFDAPPECDAEQFGEHPSVLDGQCRCMTCSHCGHHAVNTSQGHFGTWCRVTRAKREFHACCPDPAFGCELEGARNEAGQ